jgi:uncharacterized protein (DUF2336 family)
MATFLDIDEFERIIDEPDAVRRSGLACRLYADFDAGALDAREERAAQSIFRAVVRDRELETRARFARFVAASRRLAPDLAGHLAGDVRPVALVVIARSPVLNDATLVDLAASRDTWRQIAIARRAGVSPPVAAALIEVASAAACEALIANPGARLPAFGFDRLIARFPDNHELRDALLGRPGAPAVLVERHVSEVADRLTRFVTESGWLDQRTARVSAGSAVDHALISYASRRPPEVVRELAERWARDGRLTGPFLIRAGVCGSSGVYEHAIAALARIPVQRIRALVRDRGGYGFGSVCARMGLASELEHDLARIMSARHDIVQRNPHAPGSAAVRAIAALVYDPRFLPRLALSPMGATVVRDIARSTAGRAAGEIAPPPLTRAA